MFKGRKLLIATKHGKEQVIAPVMERELGVTCFTTSKFDTDQLGTFSGEIERKNDAITTLRQKCITAMELENCDLAIASEGSFGQHPSVFFVPADDELLLFIDKKNNIEIIARELSTETNFNGATIKTEKELLAFAKSANFPSHALIIKNAENDFTDVVKEIESQEQLIETFNDFISKHGKAFVETDMRAMYNPTRMKVIENAAIKLVNKIKSRCPRCKIPGFGITDARPGLPCDLCGCPTRSTISYIFRCAHCNFLKEDQYPHGKQTEDPTYCDVCNP